jgi:hypothetical protein
MNFLSKPKDFNYREVKQYEKFHFSDLSLTERNWVGIFVPLLNYSEVY